MKQSRPLLCLDFDGVVHGYGSGWKGPGVIPDQPVPGVGWYLLNTLRYCRIAIFSSRSRSLRGRLAMKSYVRDILRSAAFEHSELATATWSVLGGLPTDWEPWTIYDKRDQADEIYSYIEWPWFKPAAVVTIDDRALTFNGNWLDPAYSPAEIMAFRPWNKRDAVARHPTDAMIKLVVDPHRASLE